MKVLAAIMMVLFTVMASIVPAAVPLLVTVTANTDDVLITTPPKSRSVGSTMKFAASAAVPVPVKSTVDELPAAASLWATSLK